MPESEKAVERALAKLRRLPENTVCPNCLKEDLAGFTAICWPFKTFVCSNCKSAHQSFSHKCKSSSQSIWTMEEVKALGESHGGGNRLAREMWMATMPESERPDKESLEAIKRFVERVYIDEMWKSKEPPQERGNAKSDERKHKQKRRERAGTAGTTTGTDTGDAESHPTSRSTSRTSSPKLKHRSHKRRGEPQGWGAADFGMYNASSSHPGGDGWGMSEYPAMPPGQPCDFVRNDGSYGYNTADPFARQQMLIGNTGIPPSTSSSTSSLRHHWGTSAGHGMGAMQHQQYQQSHAPVSHSMGAVNGIPPWLSRAGQEQPHQQQALAFAKQPTSARSHAQMMYPPYGAGPGGLPPRPYTAPNLPSAPLAAARTPRNPARSPARILLRGREPVTLHPTNPWAEDLGARLIHIEPTNPWADVVASSFARGAAPSSTPTRKVRCAAVTPSAMSCGSQQTARAQQADLWVC